MGTLEIVSAVVLIIVGIVITFMVLMQEANGSGLSGAISGTSMLQSDSRSYSANSVLAKYTKYAAIVLFVLAIGVNFISLFAK
jgi:protein translocase, SecG subunit